MTIYDTHRSTATATSSRVAYRIVQFGSDLIAWNDQRRTRKALSALSDHELYDIGLSRSDISNVATRR